MWSDNETTNDLLGFRVHCDLIREVVTDSALLPVVFGVFGDWGGGKSSIMKMLEEDLNSDTYEDVACLYFNGWLFEGYEDAKTALLTSILVQLGEHKRFKDKVKDGVVGLLRRVRWLEVSRLAVKNVGAPLAVAAATVGMGGALPVLASVASGVLAQKKESEFGSAEAEGEADEDNWLSKVIAAPDKPDLLEARKFRDEFARLLEKSDIRVLVVLIDDLDRCLPDRIIETMEAIKLFVSVPRTAFVIGADPRIIRHAIATRYAEQRGRDEADEGEAYDIVKDYLEKLIQIPYNLPRLSPAEMETYINLLLCNRYLPVEQAASLRECSETKRRDDCYTAFGYGDVKEALGGAAMPPELAMQLSWSSAVALSLTEGLKGNPRQVKRMLNAMVLRTKLAAVAKLEIKPEVLSKLMVLEYTAPERFRELDTWQTASKGFPPQLHQLENEAGSGEKLRVEGDGTNELSAWQTPRIRDWLTMDPPLSDVDLRDYFWVARDRTKSTLTGASLVPPLVKRLFMSLIGGNSGIRNVSAKEAQSLSADDRESLLHLLEQQATRHPEQDEAFEALRALAENSISEAAATMISAVQKAAKETMSPSVPGRLVLLATSDPSLRVPVQEALEALAAKSDSPAGTAAAIELKQFVADQARKSKGV